MQDPQQREAEARWIETAQFDILAATVRCIHSPPLADVLRTIDRAEGLITRLDGLAGGEIRDTVLETRDTVAEARAAIADTRRLLADDAPVQQDLRAALQELTRAAEALRHLADTLDRHPEALLRGKPEDKP